MWQFPYSVFALVNAICVTAKPILWIIIQNIFWIKSSSIIKRILSIYFCNPEFNP